MRGWGFSRGEASLLLLLSLFPFARVQWKWVQHLSLGVRCRLWVPCPGSDHSGGGAADQGRGTAPHQLPSCPWTACSPVSATSHPSPAASGMLPTPGPCLLLQLSLSFSLSASLSLALGGRWMSGVYISSGRPGLGGGACWWGWGCMRFRLHPLGCTPSRLPQLLSSHPRVGPDLTTPG